LDFGVILPKIVLTNRRTSKVQRHSGMDTPPIPHHYEMQFWTGP